VSALESIINLKLLYFGEKMGNYKAWSWTVPRPGLGKVRKEGMVVLL
jgi:hypothetical protein